MPLALGFHTQVSKLPFEVMSATRAGLPTPSYAKQRSPCDVRIKRGTFKNKHSKNWHNFICGGGTLPRNPIPKLQSEIAQRSAHVEFSALNLFNPLGFVIKDVGRSKPRG